MIRQCLLLFAVLCIVAADHMYKHDDHHDDHHGYHDDHHANIDYKFYYDIKDDKHYNYQTREEKKEGKNIYGSYTLMEPDGKKRVVKYKADDHGFHAEVNHEGGYKHDHKYEPQHGYH